MPISVGHIVDALSSLRGEAHLNEIVRRVLEIAPRPFPQDPGASVRARIQERCREAASFKNGDDLFESVHGIAARKGVWRLRADPLHPAEVDGMQDGADAFIDAAEGRVALRIHLRRERSRRLVEAFKAQLEAPVCEACGMNSNEVYGDLGGDYIEAHHKVPVAALDDSTRTRLSDLAALCANCHRIIHANNLLPVERLAEFLRQRRTNGGRSPR
jgi:putative restriction endonuclease